MSCPVLHHEVARPGHEMAPTRCSKVHELLDTRIGTD
jgi:hypothetical protein